VKLSKKVVALSTTLLLLSLFLWLYPNEASANTYCNDCTNYADNLWQVASLGASTQVQVEPMHTVTYSGYVNGSWQDYYTAISNDLYFKDTQNSDSQCSLANGFCYVYAGYGQSSGASPIYFWGDNRPGSGFNFHYVADASIDTSHGTAITIQILRKPDTDKVKNQWTIDFIGTGNYIPTQTSTDNSMSYNYSGNYIIQGQAAYGPVNVISPLNTSNGSANNAEWRNSRWTTASYITYFETNDGFFIQGGSGNPPYAGWFYTPSVANPIDGGLMFTHCC
jgi:hypothetical protein